MTTNPPNPAPDEKWGTRLARAALRAAAALAATLGLAFKAGATDSPSAAAQKDAPREPQRVDSQSQPAELGAGSMHALLQGSWAPPPQLGASQPAVAEADKKPKFDDLGFISHIDSGFNDFNDRFGGR